MKIAKRNIGLYDAWFWIRSHSDFDGKEGIAGDGMVYYVGEIRLGYWINVCLEV